MNFWLLAAYFISASFVFATPYPSVSVENDSASYLSESEVTRLMAIFPSEDNPEMVSAIWGDCRRSKDRLVLLAMIVYHRNESFKLCFPRTVFVDHQKMMLKLLLDAYRQHNYEIFSYILSQDLPIGKLAVWKRPWLWSLDELKDMATRHPERIPSLLPNPDQIARFTHDLYVRNMVDFIEHCASINESFVSDEGYNPTNLLRALIQNESLNEGQMDRAVQRLIRFGAVVDAKILEDVKRDLPNMLDVHQLLNDATAKVKEPGCD